MRQKEIFLYEDKENLNPDRIEGQVPFRVSDRYIFFGPGQTALRKVLRDRFLAYNDEYTPEGDLYVIGVNRLSKEGVRKILWVGRIIKVMTFYVAYRLLDDPDFESLRMVESVAEPGKNLSPLHVAPLEIVGNLSGYRHRSELRSKTSRDGIPEWVKDVIDPRDKGLFSISQDELLLSDMSQRKKVFKRDCCFICDNIFFADGKGMPITPKLVSLLDEKQPGQGVDEAAIFGYTQGRDGTRNVNGMKGSHLHIRWRVAESMLDIILNYKPEE